MENSVLNHLFSLIYSYRITALVFLNYIEKIQNTGMKIFRKLPCSVWNLATWRKVLEKQSSEIYNELVITVQKVGYLVDASDTYNRRVWLFVLAVIIFSTKKNTPIKNFLRIYFTFSKVINGNLSEITESHLLFQIE